MQKANIYQKLIAGYFAAMVAFWLYLFFAQVVGENQSWVSPTVTTTDANYWYSFLFGLIPLVGGIIGMVKSSIWGGLKSALGKAVFFTSLGLVLWGLGEAVWSYYNFFENEPAPYPSWADLGFAPSIFFWILGAAYLSVATGALYALKKSHWAKVLIIAVPILLILPSYYFQVHVARGGVIVPEGESLLKATLDILYPFGDFLALTLAAVVYALSYRLFGGIYRRAVSYLLAGLAVMYCGDSIFAWSTTKGTYYNANWGDLILTTGLFLISYGILAFATKPAAATNNESV